MTLCTAPRHGDGDPPETEPHAHLCKPCRITMARDLRRLPGLHADLEYLLVTSRPGGHGDGSGLPVNEPVADCRSQIRHDLTWWARAVTEERGLDAPPAIDGDWAANPVAVMAGWLAGQATWISFRAFALDMAGALHADHGRALALLDPWVTKRFEIPGRDGVCLACSAGRVQVVVYASEGDRRRSFIGCPECGERWEPESWSGYGRQVIRRRAMMVG